MSGKLYSAMYDRVMGDAIFPVMWTAFRHWKKQLGITPVIAVDLGCGTGRFVQALGRLAERVYGIDSSPWMCRIAKNRNFRPNTSIFRQDIRHMALPEHVDLITANYDTLNYITSGSEFRRVLGTCHTHLKRRGHLYFDVLTGDGDRPRVGRIIQSIRLPGIRSQWTTETGRSGSKTMIDSVGRNADGSIVREKESHVQRWYSSPVIENLLQRCGFSVLGTYKFGTCKSADRNAFWMQVIAQKNNR